MRRLLWWYFAPDGPGGGGGNSPGNSAPSGAGGGSATPPASPPSGGGSGGTPSNAPAPSGSGGTPMQSPQTQSDVTSFRDAARDYGIDLSGFQDDHAAMQHLASQVQALGQLQQLDPYAQAYQQNAVAFQQFLQQQQTQLQAQQQQQQKGWWNPPEYNPAWERLISVDPTTDQYTVNPGGPLNILMTATL